jgi:hypothetical protein
MPASLPIVKNFILPVTEREVRECLTYMSLKRMQPETGALL